MTHDPRCPKCNRIVHNQYGYSNVANPAMVCASDHNQGCGWTGNLSDCTYNDVPISYMGAPDMVDNPSHYQLIPEKDIEAIDVIKAALIKIYGPVGYKAYCHGNMIKYTLRDKADVDEDVAKVGKYAELYEK